MLTEEQSVRFIHSNGGRSNALRSAAGAERPQTSALATELETTAVPPSTAVCG